MYSKLKMLFTLVLPASIDFILNITRIMIVLFIYAENHPIKVLYN